MPSGRAANLAMERMWTGPLMDVDCVCTSSLFAIGDAMAGGVGEVDVAIADGAEAPLSPFWVDAFAPLGALSARNDDPQHASRPFDAKRDGLLMGDGVAFCVLERLDDALAQGYGNLRSGRRARPQCRCLSPRRRDRAAWLQHEIR